MESVNKYAPKNPVITFVRYEHFAYTGQKYHAMSPKHGDKRFATYREAWEWLYSLTCDSFASYTYDEMVCVNCGGHPWNHDGPCSCVKVADSDVKWTCELNGCDCIVHGCSGIAQRCPMCLSVLGMGYDGLSVLWVCPDCPWFIHLGERLTEEVTT